MEAYALSLYPCPLTSVQTTGKSKAPRNPVATCVAVRNSCLPLTLLCSDVCKGRVQRYMQNTAGSFLEQWPWHSQTQTRWIMNKQPQESTRDIIGKSQEPRTTWWSLDFLRHKLSPASSEGLGRTWQNLQPEKYRESIVSAVQSLPYDWRKCENPMVLWCIIIRDVCATASSPKVPPKTRALRLWQFCLYCPGHTTDIQTLWADLKQALRENGETASWIKTQFPPLSPPNNYSSAKCSTQFWQHLRTS